MNRPWPVFEARWSSDLSPPVQHQTHPGGVSLPAGPFAAPGHKIKCSLKNLTFNSSSSPTQCYATQEVKLHKIFPSVWRKQKVREVWIQIFWYSIFSSYSHALKEILIHSQRCGFNGSKRENRGSLGQNCLVESVQIWYSTEVWRLPEEVCRNPAYRKTEVWDIWTCINNLEPPKL